MNIIKTNFRYREALSKLDESKVKYIILHHAEAIKATPEQIHQWHLSNGWAGAGYNYYVRKDGTVYEMRGDNIGSHTKNYNSISVGICAEGDYSKEKTMPNSQVNSIVELINTLKPKYPNLIKIAGHRDFNATTCPGKYYPLTEIIDAVDFAKVVQKLVNKGIIKSPDYWLQNCVQGKKVSGKYMHDVILSFVAMFRIVNTFDAAIRVLDEMRVINSPEYWVGCVEVEGQYAMKLLVNMAGKF